MSDSESDGENPLAAAMGLAVAEAEAEASSPAAAPAPAPAPAPAAAASSAGAGGAGAGAAPAPKASGVVASTSGGGGFDLVAPAAGFALERSTFSEPVAPTTSSGDADSSKPKSVDTAAAKDDFFGITYQKKTRKKDPGYTVPSGPAFADEREFERELAHSEVSSMVKHSAKDAAGDDDEFDHEFDVDFGDEPTVGAATLTAAQIAARAREKQRLAAEKAAAEEARILEEMRAAKKAGAGTAGSDAAAAASADDGAAAPPPKNALKAVQAQLRAKEEEEKQERMRELEAAVLANPGGGAGGGGGLGTLGELNEDEEEEDSDEEDDEPPPPLEPVPGVDAAAIAAKEEEPTLEEAAAARAREAEEWDRVQVKRDEEASRPVVPGVGGRPAKDWNGPGAKVSYRDAVLYLFDTFDLKPFIGRKASVEADPDAGCLACLSRPATLPGPLVDQREKLFAVASLPFMDDEVMHHRMLQTIYKTLTGTSLDCPRISAAWGDIGFQGSDPTTDLRGCGMLSLLCMLYFVTKHQNFALRLHLLSQDPDQNFPLMAAGINMTASALGTMAVQRLNGLIVKGRSVPNVFMKYFCGVFFRWFVIYTDSNGRFEDFDRTMKAARAHCNKNPAAAIQEFEAAMKKDLWTNDRTARGGGGFSDMDKK